VQPISRKPTEAGSQYDQHVSIPVALLFMLLPVLANAAGIDVLRYTVQADRLKWY